MSARRRLTPGTLFVFWRDDRSFLILDRQFRTGLHYELVGRGDGTWYISEHVLPHHDISLALYIDGDDGAKS